MNTKWYICSLFLLFSLFGTFQDQVSLHNQEIVLEFIDTSINQKNIKNTIADVKEKLLKVGVTNIAIQKTKNGTLKISYHSVINVDEIKEVLTKEKRFALNKKSENEPQDKNSFNYSIDIYELTNDTDFSKLDNKFIFEIKPNSERFTTNNSSVSLKYLREQKESLLFKTAYKTNKNSLFTKDYTSHQEPEVRAGPYVLHV